jgi:hypothetical protein
MRPGEIAPGIGCCICINQKKRRISATTVVKGYAVCDEHVELVSNPDFNIFALGPKGSTAV